MAVVIRILFLVVAFIQYVNACGDKSRRGFFILHNWGYIDDAPEECELQNLLNGRPTDALDEDIQDGVRILWESDEQARMEEGVDYEVDFKNPKNTNKKLFQNIMNTAKIDSATYKALFELLEASLNNDVAATPGGVDKTKGLRETFVGRIFETTTFEALRQYLIDTGHASDETRFKEIVEDIWLKEQDRNGKHSILVKHVFLSETNIYNVKKLLGLHFWGSIYKLEELDALTYDGPSYRLIPNTRLPQIRLKKGRARKNCASTIMGTPPEFDFSMYSLIYWMKQSDDKKEGQYYEYNFFLPDCTPVKVKAIFHHENSRVYLSTIYPSPWITSIDCPYRQPQTGGRR